VLCIALSAALAAVLGCGKKASELPVPQPQTAASSPADSASPWRMELKISPDHPSMTKPITFELHLADRSGQPVSDAQVNGALTMKVMDMGTAALKFSPKGNGDYEASIKGMDMSGPWSLAVDAANGSAHAKKNFDVTVFD
jgi:nitrogen fixation protein FixH